MERYRRMRETRPHTSTLRRLSGIVLLASLVVMALGFVPTRSAQAASISGSPFTSPGEHSFVVPAGVTSLQVVAIGGAGGTGGKECACQGTGAAGGHGGQGAMVTATVAVTAGSTLWVEVGSNGGNGADSGDSYVYPSSDAGGAGGTNGGGAGGTSVNDFGGGGGGGGYSALRVCPLSGSGCPSNPWLVVAGGGGGGAGGGTQYGGYGGYGGTPNGQGGQVSSVGGTGGSQTAPGSGGPASGGYSAGSNGSGTNGGVGSNVGSGGGGGGYYGGGGGGGYPSGGGGGSSYGPSNATYTTTSNAPSVGVGYDDTAPTLQLPSTITTNATSASGAAVNYTVTATDPDNAAGDLKISCSPVSGSMFAIGTTTVNCSASDPAGNSTTGSFQVVVQDVAPTLQLPSTITANATSASGAMVNYTVTATDPIYSASQLTIACSPKSGSTFAIGTTTVNCSVTDPAGTTVTGSFNVVVQDVSPPTLQLPSTITVDATSASGAVVTYTVTATDPDNSASQLTISCSPKSGSTFAIGTTTVKCTATDPSGNSSSGSFSVVVKGATAQVNDLVSLVNSYHLSSSLQNALDNKLNDVLTAINGGQTATACSELTDFIGYVQSHTGKGITASQATQLIAAAKQVQAVLGC